MPAPDMAPAIAGPPRRGRPPRIDLPAIVQAALDEGIEDFSVVAVAERLGVSDAAIYRYVPTRDRLQSLAADRAWAEVDTAAPGATTWQQYCHELARRGATAAERHPGLAAYVMTGPYEPATVASFERAMAELVARQPQLHVDQAYVVISRVLHAALGAAAAGSAAVRAVNAGIRRWHLDVLIDGIAAATERGDLPPAVAWSDVRAAVTRAPLDTSA